MSQLRRTLAAIIVSLALSPLAAHGQDAGALLDLLVKKGIVSDQEAEELRGELTKEFASTPAGKLKLSNPITELEIYGDARARYEVRQGESGPPSTLVGRNDTLQRNRQRYRLRLGIRGSLLDHWFFGLRLEPSTSNRSSNVTFGDDAGPWGKGSDGIHVGQAYIGYRGIRGLTLTAGKMPIPFVTTSMVWDADLNPEGLAQQYKRTFAIQRGGEAGPLNIDFFANFGQFVYDDTNPENPIGPQPINVPNNDAYLFGWQAGAKINFTRDIYLQVAPTFYNYSGGGDTYSAQFSGEPNIRVGATTVTRNQTGVSSLLIFNLPAEFGFVVKEKPVRIFSDFAVNLDATDRARAAGRLDKKDERYAYQVGAAVGRIRAKKEWQISAFWQHTEQFALDPNMIDSDLFDSRLNMQGFVVQSGYALSDAVTVNLTYGAARQIDLDLGTGGAGDIGVNPLRNYQIFQADLNLRF
jgi:hypothetical protein